MLLLRVLGVEIFSRYGFGIFFEGIRVESFGVGCHPEGFDLRCGIVQHLPSASAVRYLQVWMRACVHLQASLGPNDVSDDSASGAPQ